MDMYTATETAYKNGYEAGYADGLKAQHNGVDLTNKCGSCVYAKPIKMTKKTVHSWVDCTAPKEWAHYNSSKRPRTTPACKTFYKPKAETGGD